MTSKLVVNTIEADTGISSVSFASSISMSSTSKFHFSAAGVDIGADTNINRPTAGVLGFNINSSEKLRINSSGIVQIGNTENPTNYNVKDIMLGNHSGNHGLTILSGTGNGGYIMFSDNNGGGSNAYRGQIEYQHNGDYMRFITATAERLRIDSSGRLAFGGVSNNDSYDTNARNILLANESGNFGITIRSGGSDPYAMIHFADGTTGSSQQRAGRIFYHHTSNAMIFATDNTERLRIASGGHVTISANSYSALTINTTNNGTNGPEVQLMHTSTSPAAGDIVGQLRYSGKDSAGNTTLYAKIESKIDDPTDGQETGHLEFSTRGYSSYNSIFRLKNRGTASAPSYTADDMNGIILDVYNTGNPYPRYMNFIAKGGGNTDSNIGFWTEAVGGSPTEKLRITSGGVIETGTKTITGGNNLAIQNFKVKGVWSGGGSIGKEIELISGYDSAVKMVAIGYNLTNTSAGYGGSYGGDLVFHTQPLYNSPTTPIPESMRIGSTGLITSPTHCAFEVKLNGDQSFSNASRFKINFNYVANQQGASFDTSNNRFTAPATGYYQFNVGVYSYYSTYMEIDGRCNGAQSGAKNYRPTTRNSSGSDTNPGASMAASWIVKLTKGDYYEIFCLVNSGSGTRNIYSDLNRTPTWWSGYLIC